MTKIDIFSGFLGAGKTTLIKKLIAEAYTGEKIVLIENEFGEIAIDGGFLKDSGVQINEMNSGCICCSLVGDFADALQKVLAQFHPDRILIEPSGVGKLSDVIRAVQGVQSDELVLNGFTTVVDANKCRMYMKNFGEFFNNQVENASAIILSRTEGIRPEKLDAAVALLREKNPTATIVTTPWTELDGKQILQTMERRDTLSAELEHLKAAAADDLMFYGRGAGGAPTASAVVGDVVTEARHIAAGCTGPSIPLYKNLPKAPITASKAAFAVRFLIHDKPGVLAAIAAEFAKNGVSINGVNQDLKPTMTDPGYDGEIQQLRVVTHLTDEETLRNTVKAVQALDFVTGDPSILRVLD